MKLKEYTQTTKSNKLTGSVPSGFKSGDSSNELMIVEPLIKHPEISGLYRAVDPETGWKGWVEYSPPTATQPQIPQPTEQEIKRNVFQDKLEELQKKKRYVDLGILKSEDILTLQQEVKQLATELGEI